MGYERTYDDAVAKAMRLIAERDLPPLDVIPADENMNLAYLVSYIIKLAESNTELELLKKVHGVLIIAYLMGYQKVTDGERAERSGNDLLIREQRMKAYAQIVEDRLEGVTDTSLPELLSRVKELVDIVLNQE